MPRMELSGQRFGRLTVLGLAYARGGRTFWECSCDCGVKRITRGDHLKAGLIVSCGCYRLEQCTTHGRAYKNGEAYRTYRAYTGMLSRVSPNSKSAKDYYGRGIGIDDPGWVKSIDYFIQDMGFCPEGLTIDRVDNNKGYSKSNCRWATRSEQSTNKRDSVVTPEMYGLIYKAINIGGKDTHIARELGVTRSVVSRIRCRKPIYCTRPEYIEATK